MRAAALASLLAAAGASSAAAFEIGFPASGDYWVACKVNTINWSANQSDPSIFSVALLPSNQTSLRGSYLLLNAIETSNGTAHARPNCVPTGDYKLLFVNASNYALDEPEVYVQSASFQIRSNDTELPSVTPNTGAFNGNNNGASSASASGSSGSSGAASASSSSGTPGATGTRTDASFATRANAHAVGAVALLAAGLACVA